MTAAERGQRPPASIERETSAFSMSFLACVELGVELVDPALILRGGVGFVHFLNVIDDPFLQKLREGYRFLRRSCPILFELFDPRDESPVCPAMRGQFRVSGFLHQVLFCLERGRPSKKGRIGSIRKLSILPLF